MYEPRARTSCLWLEFSLSTDVTAAIETLHVDEEEESLRVLEDIVSPEVHIA